MYVPDVSDHLFLVIKNPHYNLAVFRLCLVDF